MNDRKATGRLQRYIDIEADVTGSRAAELIPSTHISDAYNFDDILSEERLGTSLCDVMNEELVYLFYGRPSYRTRKTKRINLEHDAPIVFIFDTNKLQSIRNIFPFDSGAFKIGLYSEYFNKNSKLEDFQLTPGTDTLRNLVRVFYGSNEEYFKGASRQNYEPSLKEFEVEGLREMSKQPPISTDNASQDERSNTIEIQIDEPLYFTECLLGVVLPTRYLDDDETRSKLKTWNVSYIGTYDLLNNVNSELIAGLIYAEVAKIYKLMGVLQ